MPAPHRAETVERARGLVTTTTRPLSDIAAEVGVSEQTLRRWIKAHGWTRPPGAEADALRKIPSARYPALQRLYENRGKVADIAVVAGCSLTQINRIAAAEGWTSRRERADLSRRTDQEPSAAIAEIQTALCDPALTRGDAVRLIERAATLTASDALGGGPARGPNGADPGAPRGPRQRPARRSRRPARSRDHPSGRCGR